MEQVVPVPSAFGAGTAAAEWLWEGDLQHAVTGRVNFHAVFGKDWPGTSMECGVGSVSILGPCSG